LKEILAREGREMNENVLYKMFKEFDITNDDRISFEEFTAVMEWEQESSKDLK
jgi:Ca2+-binding EF-hand superfamily protein